jgi:hypothetical protein
MGDLGQRNVPELPKGLRSGAGGVGPLRAGRITLEEALKRYQLTEEEYRGSAPSSSTGSPACAARAFSNIAVRGRRAARVRAADWRFGVVSERAPAAGRATQRRLARPATRAENRRPAPA